MANILIIDDDEIMAHLFSRKIGKKGHYVRCAPSLQNAYKVLIDEPCDLILSEVRLPDGDGLEALHTFSSAVSSPQVIIFTEAGNPAEAKRAIKEGAWTYINRKSLAIDEVMESMTEALEYRIGKQAAPPPSKLKKNNIVGNSPALCRCLDLLSQAAGSSTNVLINGETGTGKELFARAIHQNSARAKGNFVTVDCTTLPDNLVESVLFGHAKGSFTGATQSHEGFFMQADGGTLFLDEVGELPLSHQKAFLRIIQERRFRAVGGNKEIESDFRLIAATNRDLNRMVQEESFRKDLLFRLQAFLIISPPLRERPDDTKELLSFHCQRICQHSKIETKQFSPGFLDAVTRYDWPGNVRELVNALDRAIAAAHHEATLYPRHLPNHIRVNLAQASFEGSNIPRSDIPAEQASPIALAHSYTHRATHDHDLPSSLDLIMKPGEELPKLKDCLDAREREYWKLVLRKTGGNVQQASKISGLSRSRLYAHFKDLNLSPGTIIK